MIRPRSWHYGLGVRCPRCGSVDDKVVDSRLSDDGTVTRRRRQCASCDNRFTTFERLEAPAVTVVKRGGETVRFEPAKLESGVRAAIKGRPVSDDQVAALIAAVVERVGHRGGTVTSEQLGLDVLELLAELDHVAYLRFASVYKGFDDPEDFQREVGLLKQTPPKSA